MNRMMKLVMVAVLSSLLFTACGKKEKSETAEANVSAPSRLTDTYTDFTLTSDLNHLSANQKKAIAKMIEVAKIMDELFWMQSPEFRSPLMPNFTHH